MRSNDDKPTLPTIRAIIIVSGLLLLPHTAPAADGERVLLTFCTRAGPVQLAVDGDAVSGSYQIVLPNRWFAGTISGRRHDHLFDARWSDEDGDGRIVFGFSSNREQFLALYNADDDPDEWFTWNGKQASVLSDDERHQYVCSVPDADE